MRQDTDAGAGGGELNLAVAAGVMLYKMLEKM